MYKDWVMGVSLSTVFGGGLGVLMMMDVDGCGCWRPPRGGGWSSGKPGTVRVYNAPTSRMERGETVTRLEVRLGPFQGLRWTVQRAVSY